MTLTETINKAGQDAGGMVGTPKQVAWAEQLADTRTTEILDILRAMQKAKDRDLMKTVKQAVTIIKINRAAWWIDQRNTATGYLLLDEFLSNLR